MLSVPVVMLTCISPGFARDNFSLDITSLAQKDNAVQYAGIYFLPDLKDSGLGFNSKTITTDDSDRNQGEQCKGYDYSRNGGDGTKTCSSPKSLYLSCPFDT